MDLGWKSARAFIALVFLYICWSTCPQNGWFSAPPLWPNAVLAGGGSTSQMPAFYDGELFTVNMKEMPHSDPLVGHNSSINTIYASNDLDEEQDFIPVIDAIQGEGFNPLWQQVLIVFNQGFTPHQFVSEEDILAAAAGSNPEITLVVTDEVYRCSVVGKKH